MGTYLKMRLRKGYQAKNENEKERKSARQDFRFGIVKRCLKESVKESVRQDLDKNKRCKRCQAKIIEFPP